MEGHSLPAETGICYALPFFQRGVGCCAMDKLDHLAVDKCDFFTIFIQPESVRM